MRQIFKALALLTLGVGSAQASVILSTDFDGRTVSGSTASNLTWVANGVADPGDLTAQSNPDGLFNTAAAQNRFAPDRNLHNEGSWFVDIPIVVGASSINLTTISLDAFIFSNAGALQTVGRDLDLSLALLDNSLLQLDLDTVLNIYPSAGTISQPVAVGFDLSGNTLIAGASYTLRLTAFGTGSGNNAGIDNLAINGDVLVPLPATVGLVLLGGLSLLVWRRRMRV